MKYGNFIEIQGISSESFSFISNAISDDETRYFMNFAYCEDDKLISTDGRRLHILDLSKNPYRGFFNEGKFYKHLKSTKKTCWFAEIKEDVGNFPNWKRVVPDNKESVSRFEFISYRQSNYRSSIEYSKLLRMLPSEKAINFIHLNNLILNEKWTVYLFDGSKPIIFESENGVKAVMMHIDAKED